MVFLLMFYKKSLNNAFHPHTEFVGGSGKAGFLTGFHETG